MKFNPKKYSKAYEMKYGWIRLYNIKSMRALSVVRDFGERSGKSIEKLLYSNYKDMVIKTSVLKKKYKLKKEFVC